MKRQSIIIAGTIILIFIFGGQTTWSQDPPMIEKHIFSPQDDVQGKVTKGEPPRAKKVEREISFTGIIISPKGKLAMIKERGAYRAREGEKNTSGLYKEGDEINGMTLKEIGPNYIVLLKGDKEVRLKLYKGEKRRPLPPPVSGGRKPLPKKPRIPKRLTKPPGGTKRHISRPILRNRPRSAIPRKTGLTTEPGGLQ